jgi:membrane fusion protein, copper/silver efflux system
VKKKHMVFLGLGALVLAFIGGIGAHHWLGGCPSSSGKSTDKKILYWIAPMDPNYRRDKPGKSPMGMDLIPVYEGGNATQEDTSIKNSPNVEHNLGVRTTKVKRQNISRVIDTVGSITVDENRIEHTHVYTDGWIKELLVKTKGEKVTKGQLLFRIYSPALVNAQKEYLLALKAKNTTLQEAAKKKLYSLGFSKKQMTTLKKSKKVSELVDAYSEQGGILSQLNVAEGMFVKPDTMIIVVEDLSKIWLIAEVFERQSNWVKVGQKAEMSLPYIPGKTWPGEVNYIYPELDPKSHTLKVRMIFENESGDLKLNMFADVKIYADPKKASLVIPREAVIYTGKETRVVVKTGKGSYIVRPIKIGIEFDEMVEVLEGLKAEEIIVTSAQFLIDSESSLSASYTRTDADSTEANPHARHKH